MRKNLAGPKVSISLLRKNQEIMEVYEPPLKHKGLRMILTLKWWGNLKNFKLQLPLLQRKESGWLMRLHFFWRNKGERQTGNHQRKYLRDWRKQSIADKSLSSVMTLLKDNELTWTIKSEKSRSVSICENYFFKVVKKSTMERKCPFAANMHHFPNANAGLWDWIFSDATRGKDKLVIISENIWEIDINKA